jgi:hypothetical protein
MTSKSVPKLILLAVFLFLCLGCPLQKMQSGLAPENAEKKELSLSGLEVQNRELVQLKQIASSIRFVASVEREILKIIRPGLTMANTQFEILNLVFDQRLGTKKNFGNIDCKLYNIQKKLDGFEIYKLCQKPSALIATISMKDNNLITIQFLTKEWTSIVGQSVALISPDRICKISLESEKVYKMTCEHTAFVVGTNPDIQELRLVEFVFDQKANQQVQVSGGYYKNLIEHRKIKLNIPFDGKIKIIEKELKIHDDFVDIDKQQTQKSEDIQSNQTEVHSGKKSSLKEENQQKSDNNQTEDQGDSKTEKQSEDKQSEENQ